MKIEEYNRKMEGPSSQLGREQELDFSVENIGFISLLITNTPFHGSQPCHGKATVAQQRYKSHTMQGHPKWARVK